MKYCYIVKVLCKRFVDSFVAAWNVLAYSEPSWIRSVARAITRKKLGGPRNEFRPDQSIIETRRLAMAKFDPVKQAELQAKFAALLNEEQSIDPDALSNKEMQEYVSFLSWSPDDSSRTVTYNTAVEVVFEPKDGPPVTLKQTKCNQK